MAAKGSRCGLKSVASLQVSKEAGLGRVEVKGKVGAILGRDEGIVTMLDLSNPRRPRPTGVYDDDISDSFDGDLAFSDDGRWLFYARQTHQFSKDGLHILDVEDPSAPVLSSYIPAGGAFRVAYYESEGTGWIFVLDAIGGLLVYRFEPTTGIAVPVFVDALPELKVGGPASAGIVIEREDPQTGAPLMYVSTGKTGLQIFDISDPASPVELGAWDEMGLAEIEVSSSKKQRLIYAAPEYWFDKNLPSEVVVLDATDPNDIREVDRFRALSKLPTDPTDSYRLQGMVLKATTLYVAHSTLGLVGFDRRTGAVVATFKDSGARNPAADVVSAPYTIDVEAPGGLIYLTDASTGRLIIVH